MLRKLKKRFAYLDMDKPEHGFTLLSLLIAMTIFFTTLPFLVYLIKTTTYSSSYDELSTSHFFQYIRNDLLEAKDYRVESNTIKMDLHNGKTASIEKYKKLIRRQVDGKGHEVYLRDVEEVLVTPLSYGIHIVITTLQGEQYEKTIVFYE